MMKMRVRVMKMVQTWSQWFLLNLKLWFLDQDKQLL